MTVKLLGYPSGSEVFKTVRGLVLAKMVLDFTDRMGLGDGSVKGLNKVPTDYRMLCKG